MEKLLELSKLFPEGKNSVVVAMDHGQTFGPMPGLDRVHRGGRAPQRGRCRPASRSQMIRFTGHLVPRQGQPHLH